MIFRGSTICYLLEENSFEDGIGKIITSGEGKFKEIRQQKCFLMFLRTSINDDHTSKCLPNLNEKKYQTD